MKPLPKPDQVIAELEHLRRLLPEIEDELRWAYNACFAVPKRRHLSEPIAKTSDHSDQTVAAWSAGERARKRYSEATHRISAAVDLMRSVDGLLATAPEKSPIEKFEPPTACSEDHAQANAAKERRAARGEGWGLA
jgi:hypothetical protein